jgi:hypothetical protein
MMMMMMMMMTMTTTTTTTTMIFSVKWINLAQDVDQWGSFMKTDVNLQIP